MKRFETRLAECAIHCSFATLLHTVLLPLMHRLGDLWRTQQMSIVSEHLATTLLQQRLLTMLQATAPGANLPLLLCACPPGELPYTRPPYICLYHATRRVAGVLSGL